MVFIHYVPMVTFFFIYVLASLNYTLSDSCVANQPSTHHDPYNQQQTHIQTKTPAVTLEPYSLASLHLQA